MGTDPLRSSPSYPRGYSGVHFSVLRITGLRAAGCAARARCRAIAYGLTVSKAAFFLPL